MDDVDPIVVLTHKLEALIERVIDRKFTERDQKIEAMSDTLSKTHDLVNSRMTELTAALKKAAALASMLAGEEGEERGIAIGRQQVNEPPGTGDG